MAIMDNGGKVVGYRAKDDQWFDSEVKRLFEEGYDIRMTIERPPLANTRLASAFFTANQYRKRFVELVPSIQVQFVVPVAWQGKLLRAGPKMKRDERKRMSLLRAKSFGFSPDKPKGTDMDIADAMNIAEYGKVYLSWEDMIPKKPLTMDINDIDLTGVELNYA